MSKNTKSSPTLFKTPIKEKRFESAMEIWGNLADVKHAMFQHSVFCQTYLPYRNPGDETTYWQHEQGNASLSIQSLQVKNPETRQPVYLGLPYGTRARLIMAYLNTQAIKTQNPMIDVENSITAFTQALGLQHKGRDINDVKNQLARIASSIVTLNYITEDQRSLNVNFNLVKKYDLWFPKDQNQRVLWTSQIELSEDYFNELCSRAIPLDLRALASLKNSPMAIDVYSWLAQRLHRTPVSGQFITWKALKDQFGGNYKTMKKFKENFRDTLATVKLQYRDAKISEDKNKGFWLYNSPSPIPKKSSIIMSGSKKLIK